VNFTDRTASGHQAIVCGLNSPASGAGKLIGDYLVELFSTGN